MSGRASGQSPLAKVGLERPVMAHLVTCESFQVLERDQAAVRVVRIEGDFPHSSLRAVLLVAIRVVPFRPSRDEREQTKEIDDLNRPAADFYVQGSAVLTVVIRCGDIEITATAFIFQYPMARTLKDADLCRVVRVRC